eukprot:jgi/Ulvmu1/7598/UM038_0021.1
MNVQEECVQLETLINSFVDRHGSADVDDVVAQAQACYERLVASHDAARADSVKPAVELASSLEHFPAERMTLNEKRGEKRAIATLMASGDMPEPGTIREDLCTLTELPVSTIEWNSGDDMDSIVTAMVEELQARKALRDDLQQLQRDHDYVLRTITSKTESVAKLASMVREVHGKANEAFSQLSVDANKLPLRQSMPLGAFPTPLHVLYSQFLNIKAIYNSDIQVEAADTGAAGAQQVDVSIPAPTGSPSGPCTVTFQYSEEMNAVLIHSPTHPDLLNQIDPDDTGAVWPHEVNSVHQNGLPEPGIPASSRPFRWCQKLAGMELLTRPGSVATKSQETCGRTAEGFVWRVQQLISQ